MEDTHVCIADLAKKFGCGIVGDEAVSFYGVGSLFTLSSWLNLGNHPVHMLNLPRKCAFYSLSFK